MRVSYIHTYICMYHREKECTYMYSTYAYVVHTSIVFNFFSYKHITYLCRYIHICIHIIIMQEYRTIIYFIDILFPYLEKNSYMNPYKKIIIFVFLDAFCLQTCFWKVLLMKKKNIKEEFNKKEHQFWSIHWI